MRKNNILFLSYWYPNDVNTGSGIFIKRHAHAIKLHNEITVLTLIIKKSNALFKKKTVVFTDEIGVQTHQIYLESVFNKLLYVLLPIHYFILKRHFQKFFQSKEDFNIIHSNILFPCAIVGYWLSRKFNLEHIITEHWSKIDKFFNVSIYKYFGKQTLNSAKAISCVSIKLSETLKKHTINQKIHIIPNVIDSSKFYRIDTLKKEAVFTFIAVAHWSKPKNPFYFLEALEKLNEKQKINNFKLIIVGTGVQIEAIKESKYKFIIDYIDYLTPEQLNIELNKSHVFLHGSDYETFSVVIAEALMSGLPCVVSPVGIADEVINENNGYITNNTSKDWEEKILLSFREKFDYKVISKQLSHIYDNDTVAELFDKIYH